VSELYHLIYLSRLAPNAGASCVAAIVRTSRLRNKTAQISGLLVFDGARFCHYLEGPAANVCSLVGQIQMDSRHTGFRVIHQSERKGSRLFHEYGLEYALSYEEQLECLEQSDGPTAVLLFRELMPAFDLAPDCQAF